MGASSSAHAAPSSTNGGTHSSSSSPFWPSKYERHDSEEEDCKCAVPSLLKCCIPSGRSDAFSRSGSSGGGFNKKKKGGGGGRSSGSSSHLGTPLPDTPRAVRNARRRAAALEDAEDSPTKVGKVDPGIYSSRYHGLEKEDPRTAPSTIAGAGATTATNGMMSGGAGESKGSGGSRAKAQDHRAAASSSLGVSDSNPQAAGSGATVHEGKDGEQEMYAKYELCEVLGVGSTSTCHRCVKKATGESFACKIIDKRHIESRFAGMIDQFHTEIQALRRLQHPNIIQLYDVYMTDEKIYIIMEIMSGGELFDYVVQKGTLTEEEASRIVRMVTSAMVYMHQQNIIHRDLKPENLLLTHKPRSSHDIEVKIIDFGLSKCMEEPVARSFLGTRGYLAPEMLQRRDYSKSIDAWALGVIVFVLLCGCLPFDDDAHALPDSPTIRAKFKLRFPRWSKNLSPSAKDLLSHLLDVDSRRRYTAEQALKHPWVRGETASRNSLLQSPGRIKMSPAIRGRTPQSQATKEHVSNLAANRAHANAGTSSHTRPQPQIVRKKSI